MLFCVRRYRRVATGIALAAATLIKLYPIALFPALYRRSAWRDWRMPAVVAAIVTAGYACYSSVGTHVLGFLPEYAKEEGLDSGSRYFLLTLARHGLHWDALPTSAFYVTFHVVVAGVSRRALLPPHSEADAVIAIR